MNSTTSTARLAAPDWMLLGSEPVRAVLEYARMRLMNRAALARGDGHPVVIFPGLAADHRSIGPLTQFCRQLGYAASDWGRGFNAGPQGDIDAWIDELAEHVDELARPHHRTMSLIGWSLGGIYAREVAKKLNGRVRQVITIGTPFAGTAEQTNAAWVYRLVNGQRPVFDEALMARMRVAPDVPTTSVFSRSDGIVAWQTCIQSGRSQRTENIEVTGSHLGLGWNTQVLSIIAERLGQPANEWQRHGDPVAPARDWPKPNAPCARSPE
jgi:pimeloyl-ACP methyl ester carboxylesterase